MKQLVFDLPYRPAYGRADFLVSQCNREAFDRLECWPDWPAPALVLHGPAGSGKSHLAHLWAARCGARILTGAQLQEVTPDELALGPALAIDDAEDASERALLHLHNCCAAAGTSLLILMRRTPAFRLFALPDLASRLRALPCVAIAPPDDELLAAVMLKGFADRQLQVTPALIAFLLPRIERSFAAAAAIVERLDRAALSRKGSVSVALAREILADPGGLAP